MHEHEQKIVKELTMPGNREEDAFQKQNRESFEAEEKRRRQMEAARAYQNAQKEKISGEQGGIPKEEGERLSQLNDTREKVRQNLPEDYNELLESRRKVWGDSGEMDLVKKTLRLAGDAVLKQNEGEAYTVKDIEGVIKLYNDAIDACNYYVNSSKKNKSNRRYALVKLNLERMDGELKTLDRLRKSIRSGKSDGKAANILELIRRPFEEVQEKKRWVPANENTLAAGRQYTLRLGHKYDFGEDFSFGKAAERTIRHRKEILEMIPAELKTYDEEVRNEYEMIKKWAENEPLKGKWLKDIKKMKADEESAANEIYRNLDKLKNSKEENIRTIALKLEQMMKGGLQVKLDDKNTKDLSDEGTEDLFRMEYRGDDWKDHITIDEMTDRTNEALFDHEPCVADLHQGNIGNCYFITSLATLIERDPAIIKNSIADLGDKVAVRFENFGKPKTVIVKKTTMKAKGRDMGAYDSPLWVRMMEKAFSLVLAGWVNGCSGHQRIEERCQQRKMELSRMDYSLIRNGNPYEPLDMGGYSEDFIEFFTGKKISSIHSLTGFHRAAISFDDLAETARSKMKEDEIPAHSAYYDRKIREWVSDQFTRLKVKTYSEYMEALDEVEWKLGEKDTELTDHPDADLPLEERKEGFRKYLKDLKKQVKKDNRILQVDHSLVGEGAYSKKENELFKKFEKADLEKKLVTLHMRSSHKFTRKNTNKNKGLEKESGGFYTRHAYSFMGVRRLNENGRERLFVLLRNPWGDKVRMYDSDARAKKQLNTSEADEKFQKKTLNDGREVEVRKEHSDTNGIFYMEFRDFLNMSEGYSIEK